MREGVALGPRELDARKDRVVRQTVVDHQVLRAEHVADNTNVSRMAADENDGVLASKKLRDFALELAVQRFFSRNQSARADGGPIAVHGIHGGCRYVGISGKPQVIVGGKIHVFAAIDERSLVGYALMNREIWAFYSDHARRLHQPLQRPHFREFIDVPAR